MKIKILTQRFEFKLTEEEREIISEIAKVLKVDDSKAVRICIHDYWEKI